MKRGVGYTLVLIVLGTAGWLVWQGLEKLAVKEKRSQSIAFLPDLTMQCLNCQFERLSEIVADKKPLLLVLFNSECEHCQREAEAISLNVSKLPDVHVVFLSDESMEHITSFASRYFTGETEVIFGRTSLQDLLDVFGEISYPNLFLYSSQRTLIKEFRGEVKIESVLAALRE